MKYRLANVEVDTLLDALEDAVQYRMLLASTDRRDTATVVHHSDVASRYQAILDASDPVVIERITVRYSFDA